MHYLKKNHPTGWETKAAISGVHRDSITFKLFMTGDEIAIRHSELRELGALTVKPTNEVLLTSDSGTYHLDRFSVWTVSVIKYKEHLHAQLILNDFEVC